MKVGLFFGSFNPIHVGHLIIANYIIEYSDLQQIWFVVSPHNPFKEKKTLLSDHHRLMIVKEAIYDNPNMRACDLEFKMPRPSYTAKTLVLLKEEYPMHQFSLIMGEDNLNSLPKWYNYTYLLENYRIFVYPRFCSSQLKKKIEFINEIEAKIEILSEVPMINISASVIRSMIKNGKSTKYLLPEKVYRYVQEMHFYK